MHQQKEKAGEDTQKVGILVTIKQAMFYDELDCEIKFSKTKTAYHIIYSDKLGARVEWVYAPHLSKTFTMNEMQAFGYGIFRVVEIRNRKKVLELYMQARKCRTETIDSALY